MAARTVSRKIFSSIWGVHFIRGYLKALGLTEASPEYREAVSWFQQRKSSLLFQDEIAVLNITFPDWKARQTVRVKCTDIMELSIDQALTGLVDRPELVQDLVRGSYFRALDESLQRLGVELYPVPRPHLGPRLWYSDEEFTPAEQMYLMLCVGERLIEDADRVKAINDAYSWHLLHERGYSPSQPPDILIPSVSYVYERTLRALPPPGGTPPLSRDEALRTMIEALPAPVETGGFSPAWMHMFPRQCVTSPVHGSRGYYYGWRRSADERQTLAKLAGRLERLTAKAKTFLLKDAQGQAAAAETPWTAFRNKSTGLEKDGRLPFALVLGAKFVPFLMVRSFLFSLEDNLAFWDKHGVDDQFIDNWLLRWNFSSGYVLELLYMPREDALKQPEATVAWRTLARFAWAWLAKGAVMPVPCLYPHSTAIESLWLPRLDVPAGAGLFSDLCRLLEPFLDDLFVRERPFEKDDPDCVRKTVLFLITTVITGLVERAINQNLVSKHEPNDVTSFIAMRYEIRKDFRNIERLKNFFSLPIALLELPGRPALEARRTEDGNIALLRGIFPFGENTFIGEEELSRSNRARLRYAVDTVLLAKAEDLDDKEPVSKDEKYPRRRPAGVSLVQDGYRIAPEGLDDFIREGLSEMKSLGLELSLPDDIIEIVHPELTLSIDEGSALSGGFLNACALADFDWHAVLGDMEVTKELILKLIEEAGHIVEFGGRNLYLSKEEAMILRSRIEDPELSPERLDAWAKLRAVLTGNFKGMRVEATEAAKAKIQNLLRVEELPVPPEITATLRPYQERGFSWIMKNLRLGLGALIADDMGLGKTLQVIAALQQMKNDGELSDASVLVVAPASIMVNWQREFEKFAPAITVSLYHGAKRSMAEEKAHTDVVITSYGTFRRDAEELGTRKWRLMVLDEAQAIKNFLTHQSKAARLFPVPQVIGMTGTPVENRLLDYWSILAAVQPGLLGGKTLFQREFMTPIETGGPGSLTVLKRFQALTAPFILRRLKTDKSIIADLPEKRVIDRFTTLTPRQLVLYRQSLKTGLTDLNVLKLEAEATGNAALAEVVNRLRMKRRGRILMMLTQLKQITNSPALFEKKAAKKPDSGKGEALIDLLEEARDAGSKTLVFTQYREMGELLEGWIKNAGLGEPLFLHGGVPVSQRTEMVDRFQNDPETTVMVITLKAGGTGLNLTAASVVIHYDLWWNPAVENQATDRAHRIGQDKDVLVYRFVTAGTFEERINAMLEAKRKLADLTVQSREKWIGEMSDEEIAEIFRAS